ncbi:hypothetical protein THAPSDRAFT_261963 [Thalassiosira pseudonana CCMP1335]|uniref:Fe2OG dioxygenase domain-containing protein n=1 Tax=Thalassiosira pseudonana TaxID=35128 RepID=B8BWH5_THAPS|nr:hypothetical protein THAPSDRAFT_261963 [Thalassiosira pseudonana CCMP1335]EED94032.1 hypothetical protein THAPSDRAFT_261963 [Thalassiosira pseudonana CCMP1335]
MVAITTCPNPVAVYAQTCNSEGDNSCIAGAEEATGSLSGSSSTSTNINTNSPPPRTQLVATFENQSPYRADVHFDDGRFGNYINTIEANGGTVNINTFIGHKFFVTRHGVREGLVDPETDDPYLFVVEEQKESDDNSNNYQGPQFVLPANAAPSTTKCKDRYPICKHEAKRGECTNNPGWMIVNCCQSCDAKEGFGVLLDSNVIGGSGEKEKVISTHRTSSNAWCRKECENLTGVKGVSKRIEEMTGIPQNNYESFQILQYKPGEYYKSHHDSSDANKDKVTGHRVLTFFLYLNDVEEGGETHFTKLNISVKPKRGRALVWPSVLNEDPNSTDNRMYHEAKSVEKGIKYAANHWIHQYDFKTANLWGCSGSFA